MNINRRTKERDAHDLALYRKPVAHAPAVERGLFMLKQRAAPALTRSSATPSTIMKDGSTNVPERHENDA